MNTYTTMLNNINSNDYETHFWNVLRGGQDNTNTLAKGVDSLTGAYTLAAEGQQKYLASVKKAGVFRTLATDVQAYDQQYRIKVANDDDIAVWVPEGTAIPLSNTAADFRNFELGTCKLAVFFKLSNAFVHDNSFLFEDYIIRRLARNFAQAEDKAFISGNGKSMPMGILDENRGADVGVTTKELTYNDVIRLYFSLKPEYRKNGTWLMNDETALTLRTIKDANGNYIWNHSNDTILGRPVRISQFMPNAENGDKPIAFGDFSYYWMVGRRPVSIRTLTERFANVDCTGYLAYEFLDGKLIRPEAIKVIQMTDNAA